MLLSDIYIRLINIEKHMYELKALFKVQKIIDNFEILIIECVLSPFFRLKCNCLCHMGEGKGNVA